MDTTIELYAREKNDKPAMAQYEFDECSAFLQWMETYFDFFDFPQFEVWLEKHHIQDLMNDLNKLTPENCMELFPVYFAEEQNPEYYGETYWSFVGKLKEQLSGLLQDFDWEHNYLAVNTEAWWHVCMK